MIVVEGLIGVGKSTLTKAMGEALNLRVMEEPVADNPYLEKFYQDPKRYALEMQFWLMSRRFEMHQQAIKHIWQTGQGVIMDRSIYGDAVFAEKNYLDGNIDEMGFKNYMHMREVMFQFLMVPQITLFLSANAEVCAQRINMRSRNCESSIDLDYLRGLDKLYFELMRKLQERGSKVITVDWNQFQSWEFILNTLREENALGPQFLEYPLVSQRVSQRASQPVSQNNAQTEYSYSS